MKERIGIFLCECGPNIAEKIDLDKVKEALEHLPNVVIVARHKLFCSLQGKEFLKESIKENNLTRFVIAACSPKQHELTFMIVAEDAGMNPHLFQMANIREQCAWIIEDKDEATKKAILYIKAAYKRVIYHESLDKKEIVANPDVLVIGGGIAGIEASLALAGPDRKVYLIEKTESLGGKIKEFDEVFISFKNGQSIIDERLERIEKEDNIETRLQAEVIDVKGFLGNFIVIVKTGDSEEKIQVGAIIVAIGFELINLSQLKGYGSLDCDDIYTGLEFEKMKKEGKITTKSGSVPKSVGIIHCIGRNEVGYCSGVCCLSSIKFSKYIQDKLPGTNIFEFYRDLTLPDKAYQKFYENIENKGVNFIQADDIKIANEKGLKIKYNKNKSTQPVDMIILSPAYVPAKDSNSLAEMLRIPRDDSGFFTEEHPKLAPVNTSAEGIFIIGCAQGPKSIKDSISQAHAAAGKILASIIPGKKLEPEVRISYINEAFCIGCQKCLNTCNYGAIYFDNLKFISIVNEVLCHGCGNCIASCNSSAIQLKHFKDIQMHQEIIEILR
ncbi:CoB--CoM heterodisulfide reductase iron-sulfur subunit A family protein [Candidatus Dependentiae bacterium]|nr:CoB--CoM heterodisulfide reductase iron-sulfur subunit A family protein [Candidatus Dependentiae bacterium]